MMVINGVNPLDPHALVRLMLGKIWKELAEQSNGGFQSLGQALTFSTTSMTGSGGFTPGTPVSTLFKRLSKRYNEKIQKDYKKNKNRLETFNF